jgi:hypothetical protein
MTALCRYRKFLLKDILPSLVSLCMSKFDDMQSLYSGMNDVKKVRCTVIILSLYLLSSGLCVIFYD